VTDYKSFVFTKVWKTVEKNSDDVPTGIIMAELVPRKNAQGVCPECDRKCATYDTATVPRRFEFVPLWNIPVCFLYKMRRVNCPTHGVVTEKVPWGDGKCTQTVERRQFLANWARRLSWKETAESFNTSPGKVYRAVKWIVDWGLKHRDLSGVTHIGVDEIHRGKGQKYMTLVYQLDGGDKRLLAVEKDREEKSLERFFDEFDAGTDGEAKRSLGIQFVCGDMWKPYLNV